jgi:hypothetical protein
VRNENFVHCQPYSPSRRAEVAQALQLLEQSLEDRGIVVRLQAQARELVFSNVQTDTGKHPASLSIGTKRTSASTKKAMV